MTEAPANPALPAGESPTPTIRLALFQPALPKYRVPVFRELASRPGIDLHFFYASDEPVQNVEPSGFRGTPITSSIVLSKPRLLWRQAQLDLIDPSRFDVVMAGWNTRYLSLIPSLLKCRRRGIPSVLWGHGYSKRERFSKRFIRDATGNLATAVLFYGEAARKRFVERNGREFRAFVAPNALDQTEIQRARSRWLADPAALQRFKREHSLEHGPVLAFVSRLSPENRADLLLRAGAKLLPAFPHLRIAIVGSGIEEANLRRVAADCGMEKQTIFTGAVYEEENLAPWFLSSDLFVYPRNAGLSILHAMGYGLPVITTDFAPSWAPEVDTIKPWMNGMLYRDGSADDLASVIGSLLNDRARIDRMRTVALHTATQEYTLKGMVDGMERAIRYAYSTRHPASR